MTGREILARVISAREALGDGNPRLADRLLSDLERDLRPRRRSVCPECGQDCEWPGLLDEHLRTRHPDVWEATVAA